jgi:isoaspartyl peptidase/L-asparaginase-like protein (Ntn-hydrolase superfamily)
MLRPALIIHGGAGAGCAEVRAAQVPGCTAALRGGWEVLVNGGSALDAVCEAVAMLTSTPGSDRASPRAARLKWTRR